MDAIQHALLAVMAAGSGDTSTARQQLSEAECRARSTARRDRQIVQIAALVVHEQRERAAGLALEHAMEFPDDAELVARVAGGS
jgi:hypothetical protein